MLTRETSLKIPKGDTLLDGGHCRGKLSFGEVEFTGSDLLGAYHCEKQLGLETCTVRLELGGLIEAFVSDDEVGVCFDDTLMAVYSRETGELVSACFSLIRGAIDAASLDFWANKGAMRKVEKMWETGGDLVVIVNFDADGGEKMFVVISDAGRTIRPLAGAGTNEMGHDYSFPEDQVEIDFVPEGDEEIVGELLRAWRYISPVGIDFGVGVRELVLDFVLINSNKEEGMPYHVARELDLSILNGQRLDSSLTQLLAEAAFPKMDWS